MVGHGGGQPGVSSKFGFVPEAKLVVAVLTNVSGAPADAIWLAAVNTALGLALDKPPRVEPVFSLTAEQMAAFSGIYRSEEGGKLHIFASDGQVKVELGDEIYPVRASGPHRLVLKGKQRNVVQLYCDRDGRPWAAFHGLRMLRRVD